jgi:hypothetical protein
MPLILPRRAGAFLLAAAAGLPVAARADTHWRCELSRDLVRLVCRAEPATPAAAAPGAPVAVPVVAPVSTAQVHGTRFPLDPSRPWTVDLWSPPTERDRVELLARATICYRSPGCTVSLAWPEDLAAR